MVPLNCVHPQITMIDLNAVRSGSVKTMQMTRETSGGAGPFHFILDTGANGFSLAGITFKRLAKEDERFAICRQFSRYHNLVMSITA